jgi:hypothetical protein
MSTHSVELQWPYYKCVGCNAEAPSEVATFSKDGTCQGSSAPGEPFGQVKIGYKSRDYRGMICPDCMAKVPHNILP